MVTPGVVRANPAQAKSVVVLPADATQTALTAPKQQPANRPSSWRGMRMIGAVAGVHVGFAVWTYFAWYAGQVQSDTFLIRDEGWFGPETYAGGADKLGHGFSNYALTRGTAQLFESAGVSRTPRLILANVMTMASFLIVEMKDGYHHGFGFSWGDMIANFTGNALGTAMELWPALDRAIDIRLRYVPSDDFVSRVAGNAANFGEDYSGMLFAVYLKGSAIDWRFTGRAELGGILRYVNVGIGYRALGFKPIRRRLRVQALSLRIALDLQAVLEDYVFGGRNSAPHRFVHFASEILTLPMTSKGVHLFEIRRNSEP
ncbi:MAG: DUF2279 domain-containing protein [Myxococcales bacterium]|nr:DUF2279 domain-containing protein [Myxococcales bacterium]